MTDNNQILQEHLQDLHNRLVLNYNDNVPFDRLAVLNAIDEINRYKKMLIEKSEKITIQKGCIEWQAKEINRQKAEIDRYKETIGELGVKDGEVVALLNGKETAYINKGVAETLKRMAVKTAKAEAIKEFAERLKNEIIDDIHFSQIEKDYFCVMINNRVKEMVGDV